MRRSVAVAAAISLAPATAHAAPADEVRMPQLKRAYYRAYDKAPNPGRNLLVDGLPGTGRAPTRAELRRSLRILERKAAPAASPQLEAIAACESGGDPTAVDASGTYRGKYQFDLQTWASVGGSGDPAAAPEAEQDKRAAILLAQRGSSPWPVCG